MDLIKTGEFLRTLRKQKGLTQEQFAEIVNVSNRTVSRWENGNNLPDLDILIEIADYYEVELREILDGERKSEKMNIEMKETVLKSADYASMQTERHTKSTRRIFLIGAVLWFISQLIKHTGLTDIYAFHLIECFAEGATFGVLLAGILTTGRYGQKIKAFKQRLLKKI